MYLFLRSLVSAALLVLIAVPSYSQEIPLARGTRVQVRSADFTGPATEGLRVAKGFVARTTADSLWMRHDVREGPIVTTAWSDVDRLAISRGQRANSVQGMLWGGGIGLAYTSLAAANLPSCDETGWFEPCEGDEAWLIGWGTLATGLIGAGVGALIKTEKWRGGIGSARGRFLQPGPNLHLPHDHRDRLNHE